MKLTFRAPTPYFHWINSNGIAADCKIYKVEAEFSKYDIGTARI
ncbi:hypothetical protein QFZ77_007138 [Paenibacillus sp. V4I3]|nr:MULTISPECIES: hypothetical protein [unclassified Paenibacillus]MDQ0878479.1 hypothetical protein [Paenibacillus sp. V4I3]MDQ0885661.1 hypothetical protein [Paenibacillus sp. V4I9]